MRQILSYKDLFWEIIISLVPFLHCPRFIDWFRLIVHYPSYSYSCLYIKRRMRPFCSKRCFSMCNSPSSRTRPTGIHCSNQASSRLVLQHVNSEQSNTITINQKLHIRLVPHVNHDTPCHVFPVMERDLSDGTVLKLGRYNDARTAGHHLSFKSKVVSRHHAKMWCENGKVTRG